MVLVSSKGDYKSPDASKVYRAYADAFNGLVRVLNESGIHHQFDIIRLEELTSLYFPIPKVIDTSVNKENAAQLTKLRGATSLKSVKVFNEINPRMKEIVNFLTYLVDQERHQEVHDILQELSSNL